jgi:hypothetical protein
MKIPAVAIAAAFAGGILLGQSHWISGHAGSRAFVPGAVLCCTALLAVGLLFALRDQLLLSTVASLLLWISLGTFAASLTNRPLPPENISTRIAKGEISLTTPLRWYGRAITEPARLP